MTSVTGHITYIHYNDKANIVIILLYRENITISILFCNSIVARDNIALYI